MDRKVLGIPLAVWVFLVGLGLIIGLPLWLSYKNEMKAISQVNQNLLQLKVVTPTPTVEVSPTATPEATLTPVKTFRAVTVAPTKPLK